MSRKQCKRKHWSTAINPIQHAIEGASLTPDSILDKLRARELAADMPWQNGSAYKPPLPKASNSG